MSERKQFLKNILSKFTGNGLLMLKQLHLNPPKLQLRVVMRISKDMFCALVQRKVENITNECKDLTDKLKEN